MGNIRLINMSSTDEKVKVDTGATAGYLGAAWNDGVLKVAENELTYTDGGDFITLGLADHDTARTALGLAIGTDVLAEQTIGIADDNLLEVDGSPSDNEYAKFTADGLEGRTYANVLADLSGQADATFSFGNQDVSNVGTITATGLTVNGDSSLDGAVTINDSNADKDFRVEGSGATYTHLLFTDASANMVGVNEDEPKALLHLRGATCTDYAGIHPDTILLLENDNDVSLQLQAATDGEARIVFADNVYNPSAGRIMYDFAAEQMVFGIGGNERVYFTATGARFVQNEMEIDSPTTYAAFIANSHNEDAYIAFEKDEAIKWSIGFDYSDNLSLKISGGIPGTGTLLSIPWTSPILQFVGDGDKGLHYLDTEETTRWMLRVASSTNVVEILNRASHGKVEIHANTLTAGVDGDVLVATFEDDLITSAVNTAITGYVDASTGFKDNGTAGIDTTFLDNDGNTITVSGGIITDKTAP